MDGVLTALELRGAPDAEIHACTVIRQKMKVYLDRLRRGIDPGEDVEFYVKPADVPAVRAVENPEPAPAAEQIKKTASSAKPMLRVSVEVDGSESIVATLNPNAPEDFQESLDLVGMLLRYVGNGIYLPVGSKSQVASVFERQHVLARLRTLGVVSAE
jgi:hypothetical protein